MFILYIATLMLCIIASFLWEGGGGIFIVFWFIITMNSAWVQRKYLTFPLNLLKPP